MKTPTILSFSVNDCDFEAQQSIDYDFYSSPFGNLIIASTKIGICFASFYHDKNEAQDELKKEFPNCKILQQQNPKNAEVLNNFLAKEPTKSNLQFHVKATNFQVQVWKELLKIPIGSRSTYLQIAQKIGNPNAYRAVGTAIGKNPIALLIPCHRIVKTNGEMGGYKWEVPTKKAILDWEKN